MYVPVWVCACVCEGDFCLVPPGVHHCNTVHSSVLLRMQTHTHTHIYRFFIIGSRSVILFRLINNFLQLKSGLETYLSLYAIYSPLHSPNSPPSPTLICLPVTPCCPAQSPTPELKPTVLALALRPPDRPLPLEQQCPSFSSVHYL